MNGANMTAEPTAVPGRRGLRAWIVYSFLALSVACVAAAFLMPVKKRERTPPTQDIVPESYFDAPQFSLQERNGGEVRTEDLEGKVWIASFVFTRCTMGCPAVTTTMQTLQKELNLAEFDDLRLVTFTVDPENDTLDALKKYADIYKAHETRWLFLTGKEKIVRPLLQKGFKITANKRDNPKPGDEFDHSTKLFIIDKKGRVRGTFDGMQGEHDTDGERYRAGLVRLKESVEVLRKE